MGGDFEHLKPKLAREITDYLGSRDASVLPFDYEAIRPVCETLEFLFSDLFGDRDEWRWQWVDGVLPREVEEGDGTVRIFGEGIFVKGEDEWTLRPILAELALNAPSALSVADEKLAKPYTQDRAYTLEVPAEWPHVFEFDLRTQVSQS